MNEYDYDLLFVFSSTKYALLSLVVLDVCLCYVFFKSKLTLTFMPFFGCDVQGMVEKWLLQVEETMIASVRKVIGESFTAYASTSRGNWVLEWPGQIVICVSSIYWTAEVTEAMKRPDGIQVGSCDISVMLGADAGVFNFCTVHSAFCTSLYADKNAQTASCCSTAFNT